MMGNLIKGLVARLRWYLLIGLVLVVLFAPVPGKAAEPVERTFRIEASRFQYSPAVLQVNPGDRVTIDLVAQDVVHGLSIDGYNLAITADPGQTARLTFIAGRQGSFRFRCTVTCGNMHPFMIGKLKVGQNTLLWRVIALSGLTLVAAAWRLWK
jgi:heme/copper-type cytochrome/quinol oxidase subunit 2